MVFQKTGFGCPECIRRKCRVLGQTRGANALLTCVTFSAPHITVAGLDNGRLYDSGLFAPLPSRIGNTCLGYKRNDDDVCKMRANLHRWPTQERDRSG